jgi:hypothetical protein
MPFVKYRFQAVGIFPTNADQTFFFTKAAFFIQPFKLKGFEKRIKPDHWQHQSHKRKGGRGG